MLLGALALLAVVLSSLATLWKVAAAGLVVADLLLTLRNWRLRGHPAQRHGLMLANKQWLYWTAQHGWREVRLGQGSLVWSWLVVLDVKPGKGRHVQLALPWHVLPAESFRQLKVALRFGGQ